MPARKILLPGINKLIQASSPLKVTIEDGSPPMSHRIAVFRRLLLKRTLNLLHARPIGVLSITVLSYQLKKRLTHTAKSFLCNESTRRISNLSEGCVGRLTLAAYAPMECSQRRNVMGVAVPVLVNTLSVKMALKVYFSCQMDCFV
jgi:hypothetical protein